MMLFCPEELARWVSGSWKNGMPQQRISGISHDTRMLRSGDLYVALYGAHFDGHTFVREAFQRGAAAALVNNRFQGVKYPALVVPDTLQGLWDMAKGCRKKWNGITIGITGSVGKTTVKEMCADVLSVKGESHRTAGNRNNHIGLPLSMLAMPQDVKSGVFEIGMSRPGEIGPLAELLRPEIGILTDICNAHRENFESLEAIVREKMKLIEQVPSDAGMAILDLDSEWYALMCRHVNARVVTVSFSGDADYAGIKVDEAVMRVNGFDYVMPLPGEAAMRNALRAIALGSELDMKPEDIAAGLQKFRTLPMRWQESEIANVRFINDAYNANPLSMRASLRTFSQLPGKGRKWAVIGGMYELGDAAESEYAALGQFIDALNLDGIIAFGEAAKQMTYHGASHFFRCSESAEAAQILKDRLSLGDRVLLKASRGERLENVLCCFKEKGG